MNFSLLGEVLKESNVEITVDGIVVHKPQDQQAKKPKQVISFECEPYQKKEEKQKQELTSDDYQQMINSKQQQLDQEAKDVIGKNMEKSKLDNLVYEMSKTAIPKPKRKFDIDLSQFKQKQQKQQANLSVDDLQTQFEFMSHLMIPQAQQDQQQGHSILNTTKRHQSQVLKQIIDEAPNKLTEEERNVDLTDYVDIQRLNSRQPIQGYQAYMNLDQSSMYQTQQQIQQTQQQNAQDLQLSQENVGKPVTSSKYDNDKLIQYLKSKYQYQNQKQPNVQQQKQEQQKQEQYKQEQQKQELQKQEQQKQYQQKQKQQKFYNTKEFISTYGKIVRNSTSQLQNSSQSVIQSQQQPQQHIINQQQVLLGKIQKTSDSNIQQNNTILSNQIQKQSVENDESQIEDMTFQMQGIKQQIQDEQQTQDYQEIQQVNEKQTQQTVQNTQQIESNDDLKMSKVYESKVIENEQDQQQMQYYQENQQQIQEDLYQEDLVQEQDEQYNQEVQQLRQNVNQQAKELAKKMQQQIATKYPEMTTKQQKQIYQVQQINQPKLQEPDNGQFSEIIKAKQIITQIKENLLGQSQHLQEEQQQAEDVNQLKRYGQILDKIIQLSSNKYNKLNVNQIIQEIQQHLDAEMQILNLGNNITKTNIQQQIQQQNVQTEEIINEKQLSSSMSLNESVKDLLNSSDYTKTKMRQVTKQKQQIKPNKVGQDKAIKKQLQMLLKGTNYTTKVQATKSTQQNQINKEQNLMLSTYTKKPEQNVKYFVNDNIVYIYKDQQEYTCQFNNFDIKRLNNNRLQLHCKDCLGNYTNIIIEDNKELFQDL